MKPGEIRSQISPGGKQQPAGGHHGWQPDAPVIPAQVVVQGLPWKYTSEDLNAMFDDVGQIAEAEVQMGRDGRSRVRRVTAQQFCPGCE